MRKMYWNCIDDNDEKKTRLELLEKWKSLVSKYLIFVEGDSKMMLNSISLQRVNFAFLDGAHTYSDVMFEFSRIKDKQLSGDVIIYDDYNPFLFKGIVKAVDEICSLHGYSRKDITGADGRDYVIATKNVELSVKNDFLLQNLFQIEFKIATNHGVVLHFFSFMFAAFVVFFPWEIIMRSSGTDGFNDFTQYLKVFSSAQYKMDMYQWTTLVQFFTGELLWDNLIRSLSLLTSPYFALRTASF